MVILLLGPASEQFTVNVIYFNKDFYTIYNYDEIGYMLYMEDSIGRKDFGLHLMQFSDLQLS